MVTHTIYPSGFSGSQKIPRPEPNEINRCHWVMHLHGERTERSGSKHKHPSAVSSIRCVSDLPISKKHPCKKVAFILPAVRHQHQQKSQTAKSILSTYARTASSVCRVDSAGTPALIPVTRFRVKKADSRSCPSGSSHSTYDHLSYLSGTHASPPLAPYRYNVCCFNTVHGSTGKAKGKDASGKLFFSEEADVFSCSPILAVVGKCEQNRLRVSAARITGAP